MDIAKIESFLTLCKYQNFAKTSDILFISQPALSKRIKSLEDELGVPLFNRFDNHTYLTIQGEAFKPYAEQMLALYNSAKEYIQQIETLENGTLNFGATNFIGVYIVPKLIRIYHELFPSVKINMVINSSKNILEMLHKNQLEFVLLSDYIVDDFDEYIIKSFFKDQLKVIVSKDHPLAQKDACTLKDIENELFITKKESSSQYRFLKNIFNHYDFDFKNKLFISNQEAIKESVVNNVGIAIISTIAVQREIDNGLIKALDIEGIDINRNIQYVYIKNKFLTPAAKEFISLIEDL